MSLSESIDVSFRRYTSSREPMGDLGLILTDSRNAATFSSLPDNPTKYGSTEFDMVSRTVVPVRFSPRWTVTCFLSTASSSICWFRPFMPPMCCRSPTTPARAIGDRSQLASSMTTDNRRLRDAPQASTMPSMPWKCGLTCTTFFDFLMGLWWSRATTFASRDSSPSIWPEPMSRNMMLALPSLAMRSTAPPSRPFIMDRWNCFPMRLSAPAMTDPAASPSAS